MFLVADGLPGIVADTGLTAVDDTLRVGLMVYVVALFGIVVAHHVDGFRVFRLVAHHHTCQSTRDGS